MNAGSARPIVSEALIITAVCIGAWYGLVSAPEGRLARARQQAAVARAELAAAQAGDGQAAGLPGETPDSLRKRATEIDRLSGRCSDASALYDVITSLAQSSGVRMERLQPRQVPRTADPRRVSGAQSAEALGYAIDATGSYEAVVRFVRAIQHEGLTTAIASIRLTPVPGDASGRTVTASIETLHFHLTRPVASSAQAGVPESTP
jgi:hypothetical protein